MIFTNRKTNNSSNAKESDIMVMERKIVGQTLTETRYKAEQLAKLKPDVSATIEKWKGWYVITFFKES